MSDTTPEKNLVPRRSSLLTDRSSLLARLLITGYLTCGFAYGLGYSKVLEPTTTTSTTSDLRLLIPVISIPAWPPGLILYNWGVRDGTIQKF